MEHRLGGIDLIRWERRGPRNRILRAGPSSSTVVLVLCGLIGASALAGQLLGLLPRSGLLAGVPAALLIVALTPRAIALARAAIGWLGG